MLEGCTWRTSVRHSAGWLDTGNTRRVAALGYWARVAVRPVDRAAEGAREREPTEPRYQSGDVANPGDQQKKKRALAQARRPCSHPFPRKTECSRPARSWQEFLGSCCQERRASCVQRTAAHAMTAGLCPGW